VFFFKLVLNAITVSDAVAKQNVVYIQTSDEKGCIHSLKDAVTSIIFKVSIRIFFINIGIRIF